MKRCLQEIFSAISSGEPAALVTIVEKRGSTPRGVGTAMVVRLDGSQEGTIGGGSMEARVRSDALALLQLRQSAFRTYTIDAGNPTDPNSVTVLTRVFSGDRDRKMIHRALNEMEREKGYLVCALEPDHISETEYVSEQEANENPALQPWLDKAPAFTTQSSRRWVDALVTAPRVFVLGGGHVAQALVPVLALLHLRVWVIEDREELCDSARFPLAERVLCERSDQVLEELDLTEQDGIVSFVRGRGMELQTLASALRTKACYIGSIGSRANARRMRDELLSYGFSAEQVARIHAPVGLEIGAETPEEIAVSIAAEWIACRRK